MGLISLYFALFFLVVLPLNWALRTTGRLYRFFLLGACYVFYGSQNPKFLLLLIHFSFWTWLLGLGICEACRSWLRKGLLTFHLVIGIGGLLFFKYYDLLYESLNQAFGFIRLGALLPDLDPIVPVGVSFFTFQGLSYTIDVYRDQQRTVRSPLDIFIFMAFFPTVLSGPIMRAANFIPQIGKMHHDMKSSSDGFILILMGLVKKLVLSSYLFEHVVQPVFQAPYDYSSLSVAIGVVGYSMQILCDFSGYTDLVTGIALLLGYSIPPNFNHPYSARNLKEFWPRWHMSLSSWLKDYLYIPLGGNRRGLVRKYFNILITMTLGGLWHGANWNYLFWGVFHGMGLVATHMASDFRGRISLFRNRETPIRRARWDSRTASTITAVVSWLSTFVFLLIGWIFFGTKSLGQAAALLHRIFDLDLVGKGFSHYVTVAALCIIATVLLHEIFRIRFREVLSWFFQTLPFVFQVALLSLLIAVLLRLAPDGVPQFVYYQF